MWCPCVSLVSSWHFAARYTAGHLTDQPGAMCFSIGLFYEGANCVITLVILETLREFIIKNVRNRGGNPSFDVGNCPITAWCGAALKLEIFQIKLKFLGGSIEDRIT